jgi:hypothetical protein
VGGIQMKWKMTFTAIIDDEKAPDELLYLHKAGKAVENQLTLYTNSPLEGISDIRAFAFELIEEGNSSDTDKI